MQYVYMIRLLLSNNETVDIIQPAASRNNAEFRAVLKFPGSKVLLTSEKKQVDVETKLIELDNVIHVDFNTGKVRKAV